MYIVKLGDMFVKNEKGTLYTPNRAGAKLMPIHKAHKLAIAIGGEFTKEER